MWTRRKVRIAAMQALFQKELNPQLTKEELVSSYWSVLDSLEDEDFRPAEEVPEEFSDPVELDDLIVTSQLADVENDHFKFLIETIFEKQKEFDELIEDVSSSWNMNRLGRVEVLLLRIAIAEALYCEDVPVVTAIDEAVEISKFYCNEDSYTFVNGVLDTVLRKYRMEEGEKQAKKD